MEQILKNFDLVPLDVVMIVVCALLFLVLWKFLDKNLFGPYLALFEAREAATIGAEGAADAERAKAAALNQEYEDKLMAARVAAMEKKITAVNAAKSKADGIIDKAEGAAQEQVRAVRWEMAKKIDDMRSKALGHADALAETIVARVKNPVARDTTTSKRS